MLIEYRVINGDVQRRLLVVPTALEAVGERSTLIRRAKPIQITKHTRTDPGASSIKVSGTFFLVLQTLLIAVSREYQIDSLLSYRLVSLRI